jgi:hypothetical protein
MLSDENKKISTLSMYSPTSLARAVVSDSTKRPSMMSKNEHADEASMKGDERLQKKVIKSE